MHKRLVEAGQLWDSLVASSQTQTSSGIVSPLCFPLALRNKPEITILPRHPRSLHQIDPNLRKVMRDLVQGQRPWPLVIYGGVGTGKTSAALCLLDHSYGRYYTVDSLAQDVTAAMFNRLEVGSGPDRRDTDQKGFWGTIAGAGLVVLDDIGSRSVASQHHYSAVKQLLDLRVGKPTVVITNLELIQIDEIYDSRIASRLVPGTSFRLDGPDRRLPLPTQAR